MKKLDTIISNLNAHVVSGNAQEVVAGLSIDSRKTAAGYAYFAIKGNTVDGHLFIDQAIESGAKVIFCEVLPGDLIHGITYVLTPDCSAIAGEVAAAFYNYPSSGMKVVGITGTNGKTTIATLLYKLYTGLGYQCGLISTVQNIVNGMVRESTHTTPDAVSIQSLMHEMDNAGCEYVFMEVSSHAIHQNRVRGIVFAAGIFSNITHDHLDYHKTFDEYIKVKKSFFDKLPAQAFALSNIDDKRGAVMLQNTKAKKRTYAIKQDADFKAKVLENQMHGLLMVIDGVEVHFRISGLFNAYNLLAVYGASVLLGENKDEVLGILSNLSGAEGRFETYRSPKEGIIGIIDYAHTPDALLNVLATIRKFEGKGKLVTVVGCGGDRDKAKRPIMTTVACEHSDQVILTSDNPRNEDPERILDDMQEGISAAHNRKILRIADRKQAIRTAVSIAYQEDIILIAGKGHEKYQEVKGIKHPFDDVQILLNQYQELDK